MIIILYSNITGQNILHCIIYYQFAEKGKLIVKIYENEE